MLLLHQDLLLGAVPAPRPVLVRPADAEREIERPVSQQLVERTLEQAPAGEPVVVVAEAVNAVLARELDLAASRLLGTRRS